MWACTYFLPFLWIRIPLFYFLSKEIVRVTRLLFTLNAKWRCHTTQGKKDQERYISQICLFFFSFSAHLVNAVFSLVPVVVNAVLAFVGTGCPSQKNPENFNLALLEFACFSETWLLGSTYIVLERLRLKEAIGNWQESTAFHLFSRTSCTDNVSRNLSFMRYGHAMRRRCAPLSPPPSVSNDETWPIPAEPNFQDARHKLTKLRAKNVCSACH